MTLRVHDSTRPNPKGTNLPNSLGNSGIEMSFSRALNLMNRVQVLPEPDLQAFFKIK